MHPDGWPPQICGHLPPLEKVEIARRIEEAMAGRHGGARDKNLPLDEKPKGKSADIAAKAVGWSGEQYRKAKAVFCSVHTRRGGQKMSTLDPGSLHHRHAQILNPEFEVSLLSGK